MDDWLIDHIDLLKTPIFRCKWLRTGRGWIDPVSERQGFILEIDAGLSSLELEVAENAGGDWEYIINQRVICE